MSGPRLLTAGRVVTPVGPECDAVLLDGSRVAAVGRAADLRRSGLPEDPHPGGVVLPGFVDHHLHPVGYAAAGAGLDLSGARSLAAVAEAVAEHAASLPPGAPVVGGRLDDERLAEGRLPDRHLLDRAAGGRPVLITRVCAHVAVAGTAALDLAGIGPGTADPPGGSIDRDHSGRPTGVLRETAIAAVSAALEPLVAAPPPEAVLTALRRLVSLGLTAVDGIVSAGSPLWCGAGRELDTLLEIGADLPLDVRVFLIADHPEELREAAGRLDRAGGRRLFFGGWKGFADGSLGGRTAALRRPYADRPESSGLLRLDPTAAARLARTAVDLGGAAAVHAIGDAAVAAVLDLFDDLARRGVDPPRLRIEHASVLDSGLVARLAGSGAVASVQPVFTVSDREWLPLRLGVDRVGCAYPLAAMAAAGVPLIGGSDAPVEHPDPLAGIIAARRSGMDGTAALGLFQPPGGLVPGSRADLVVLDRHPAEADVRDLAAASVVAVWKDGHPVLA